MAFPVSPTNGSIAVVNSIVYQYNSVDNAWTRLASPPGNLTVTSNLTSSGNLIASNLYVSTLNWANGVSISLAGTYSNVNVEAYIGGNIGAYQIFANTNAATQATSINTINANLGAFQTFSNTNAAAQATSINTINANIGSFYTYANTKIGTNTNSNLVVVATTTSTSTTTGALVVGGGIGVAGNIISGGNITGSFGTFVSNLSIGSSLIQQDALNLNNNNLYNVNTIRINDPGTSEGIAWEGGSGWNIYESPNDLSNNTGNLQIVLSGTRVFTVDTNQSINIPSSRPATSTTTGALTVGGGVGIAGNLWVGGNIYVGNLVSIGSSTISVRDPLLYLSATSPFPYNYDIGFFSQFVDGAGVNEHTGFSRNYLDNTWTLFSNVFAEPGITINWTDANIVFDPIKVGSANIANTTISTSTTTGALVVRGGAGVGGALYIANTGDVSANIGTLFLGNASTQANIGAFYSYANTTFTTLNANIGTLFLGNAGTQANLGAFQTYTNTTIATLDANIGTLFLGNASTQANIAAFYAYANTKIGTNDNGNLVIGATTTSTSKTTGALVVGGGAGISGNAYVDRLYTTQGLFWAGNGFVISTGGGGGGGGSAAGDQGSLQFNDSGTFNGSTIIFDSASGNLVITDTTDSTSTTTGALVVRGGVGVAGNVFAGKLYTTTGLYWAGNGAVVAGGITYTSDISPHASPSLGDQWYDTNTDILYEYIEDGTTEYWVDVQSPIFNGALSTNLVGNLSITGNLSVNRAITATGNITTVANLNVLRSANIFGNILGGNIFVNRNATVVSNLTVSGYTILANIVSSGNITNSGNIITTGNVSANNVTVTNAILTGTITTGNIAAGNLSVSGNVTTGLTVNGTVNAGNLLTTGSLSGNVTNTGSLTSTGNVVFTGANVNLGDAANLHITGGSSGLYLQTDGTGNVSWQSLPLTSIQEFTATGGQTTFTIVGTYTVGTVLVFVNGIQMNSADYTATSGTTVVLTEARNAGDTVRIVSSVGASSLSSGLVLSVTNIKNFAVAMSIAMGM